MIKYIALAALTGAMFWYAAVEEQAAWDKCMVNHSKDTCFTQMAGG